MKKKRSKWCLIFSWIFVVGGVFGFIYETLFYRIDLGKWVKRGTTFGPWIPIYAVGSVLITLLTRKSRKKPLKVFALAMLISGSLELVVGVVLDKVLNKRLWDYRYEIWNWLQFGGYVCLRSVLFFGISGLFLNYAVVPVLEKLEQKLKSKPLRALSCVPTLVFIIDTILYRALGKMKDTPCEYKNS